MFLIKELPSSEVEHVINYGEFSSALIKESYVAIVMSQDWCPDWRAMQHWLDMYEKQARPQDRDIFIYIYLYNQSPFFSQFLEIKEKIWNNLLIPYVRYYSHGTLVAESNYVTPERFLQLLSGKNSQFTQGA